MGMLVAVAAFALGAFLGFAVGAGGAHLSLKDDINRLKRDKIADHGLYFGVLRRELANILIQQNPDKFLQFYREFLDHLSEIGKGSSDSIKREERRILAKYPLLTNWDQIGTHDYVLYNDNQFYTESELYAFYRDLITYQTILSWKPVSDSNVLAWKPAIDQQRVGHLTEYVAELKGTYLKQRLLDAMRQVQDLNSEFQRLINVSNLPKEAKNRGHSGEMTGRIRTSHFTAERVNVTQRERGYHFKFLDGQEGMVGISYTDDRIFVSVYGVDPETQSPTIIPTRNLDRLSVPFEYRGDVALGYSRNE